MQKTYTVDFLTKKRVQNNGVVPQYYVENSHEAIIPKEILVVAIYSHRLSFAGNVERYIAEFIGTTEARNILFGDASVDWRTQA